MESRDEHGKVFSDSQVGYFNASNTLLKQSVKALLNYQKSCVQTVKMNLMQPILFKFAGFVNEYKKALGDSSKAEILYCSRLGASICRDLVLDDIEPLRYEYVEEYWYKKYHRCRKSTVANDMSRYDNKSFFPAKMSSPKSAYTNPGSRGLLSNLLVTSPKSS